MRKDKQKNENMRRRYEEKLHTCLIRSTALEPDEDMNVKFLTVVASLSSLGMFTNPHRHESRINVAVGAE